MINESENLDEEHTESTDYKISDAPQSSPKEETPNIDDLDEDEEFQKELLTIFIEEFGELLDIYRNSLTEIRSFRGDKEVAYKEIFRVYHTLKGAAGYFSGMEEFAKFTSYHCELIRHIDDEVLADQKLLNTLRINYTRLSSAYNALNNGENLKAFRFLIFLHNF